MRLIDAEVESERLLDFIAQYDSEIQCAIEYKDMTMLEDIFFDFFNEQPTAYDVDKVIEQVRQDCFVMGFDESQVGIVVDDIRAEMKEQGHLRSLFGSRHNW